MKLKICLGLVFTVLISLLLNYSCSKKEESLPKPFIKIDKPLYEFSYEKTENVVNVNSNYKWTAIVPARDAWCKIKQNEKTIEIILEENLSLDSRKTKIKIESSNDKATTTAYINVKQAAAPEVSLSVSEEDLKVEPEEGSISVVVVASKNDWTVGYKEGQEKDWCTFTREEGSNNIDINFKENTNAEPRQAIAYVSVGAANNKKEVKLNITQFGFKTSLEIAPNELEVEGVGGYFEFKVKTNRDNFTVNKTMGYNLATVEKDVEKKIIKLTLKENDDFENGREVRFEVSAGVFPDKVDKVVKIKQKKAIKAFISTDSEVIFEANKSSKTLQIDVNRKDWEFTTTPTTVDWCSIEKVDKELKLTVKENHSPNIRKFKIHLSTGISSNVAVHEVEVTQKPGGGGVYITPSENTISFSAEAGKQSIKVIASSNDWIVSLDESDKDWCTAQKIDDKLEVSVTACEDRARSCNINLSIGEVKTIVKVTQTPVYKVGDYYEFGGKKIGIIYEISDGGKHGKAFSVKQSDIIDYLDLEGTSESNKTFPVIATNRKDGKVNLSLVKQNAEWKKLYPGFAWADKLDNENGNPGWYLPAIDEVNVLITYLLDGRDKDFKDKINKLITDVGGDKIAFDETDSTGQVMSSTEVVNDKYNMFYVNFLAYIFEYKMLRVGSTKCIARAVVSF